MACEYCKEEIICFRCLLNGTRTYVDGLCFCEDDFRLDKDIKFCPYCGRDLFSAVEKKRVFSKEKFIENMGYEYYISTPFVSNWVDKCDGKEIYIDSNGGRKIKTGETKNEVWDFSSLEIWEEEI